MPQLVRTVTAKAIPPHVEALVVEIMVTDAATDEDIEIPYIKYVLSADEKAAVKADKLV
jgi:hypothetical protein